MSFRELVRGREEWARASRTLKELKWTRREEGKSDLIEGDDSNEMTTVNHPNT